MLWEVAKITTILRVAFSWMPPFSVVATGGLLAGCTIETQPGHSLPEVTRTLDASTPAVHTVNEATVDLQLEALLNYTPPALDVRRNPFRFGPADADGHEPSRGGASPSFLPAAERRAEPSDPATPAAPTAPDRDAAVRFIGLVELRDRDRRVAVLADGDGVHHGAVNDVVMGRYRIVALGTTAVEIEDIARGTRMVLRPSGP